MVKPDAHHDYYADLECPSTADAADLKKQYKKLAFKWHPDRNRGNEQEASKRFQEVQTAHDILTDPDKRSKYDADRWRVNMQAAHGGETRSPGVNPYTTVHTGFPPPPRRAPQKAGTAPTAKQPSAGANRYADFTRNFQQTREERAKQTYSAWEQMKHNRTQVPPRPDQQQPPPPPRRAARPASYVAPGAPSAKARAGWDEATPPPKARPQPQPQPQTPLPDGYMAPNGVPHMPRPDQPNVGKSPRRPVFFPGQEKGEEPPGARPPPGYPNVQRGARPVPPPRPQPQYVPPAAAAAGVPPSGFRHVNPQVPPPHAFKRTPTDEGDRQSMPYTKQSGEKTYLNTENLSRSATGTNLYAGWTAAGSRDSSRNRAGTRHRSASPHIRSPRPPEYSSSSSSSESTDEEDEIDRREKLRPRGHYARRASADDRPVQPGVRYTHPRHPGVTVEVDDVPPPRTTSSGANSSRHSSTGATPEGFRQHRMRVSPGRSPGPINMNPIEKSKEWQEKYGAAPNVRQFDRPATAEARSKSPKYDQQLQFLYANYVSSNTQKPLSPAKATPRRPTWPYWAVPSSVTPSPKQAPAHDSTPTPMGGKRGDFLFSYSGSRSFSMTDFDYHSFFIPNDSSTSGSSTKNSSTENVGPTFSPSEWTGQFNDPNVFVGANRPPGAKSTRRGRSPPKRSATSNVFPGKTPMANAQAPPTSAGPQTARPNGPIPAPEPVPPKFSEQEWAQTFNEPSWAYPPTSVPLKNATPRSKPPRKMSLKDRKNTPKQATVSSPTKEALKEENGTGMAGKRTTSSHSMHSNGSAMDIDPKQTPSPAEIKDDPILNAIRYAVPPNTARRSSFGEDELNLDGLKDTEPLGPSNQGLHGMGDLATMLPFESQASGDANAQVAPRQRDCPPIPPAPDLPKGSLTQSAWEQFLARFDTYLAQWHMFNQTMINHFQARQNQLADLPRRWTAVPSSDGLARYRAGVDEDFPVRAHWELGWARHRDMMAAFAKVRAKAEAADLLE